jgi:hypothetical protein
MVPESAARTSRRTSSSALELCQRAPQLRLIGGRSNLQPGGAPVNTFFRAAFWRGLIWRWPGRNAWRKVPSEFFAPSRLALHGRPACGIVRGVTAGVRAFPGSPALDRRSRPRDRSINRNHGVYRSMQELFRQRFTRKSRRQSGQRIATGRWLRVLIFELGRFLRRQRSSIVKRVRLVLGLPAETNAPVAGPTRTVLPPIELNDLGENAQLILKRLERLRASSRPWYSRFRFGSR